MAMVRAQIMCCAGTGCTSSKSPEIIAEFAKQLAAHGLDKEVQVSPSGCQGLCAKGPVLVVWPDGVYYSHVSVADVEEIVTEHLLKGRVVERLLLTEVDTITNTVHNFVDTPFHKEQQRIALRNCGIVDPENIDEYIAFDGYAALAKVLTTMTPQDVLDEVTASGLRGRGGAGFPTGRKWAFAAASPGPIKYACCNADEGDPGAFMDRSILEGDPHSVLEAMTIAGYAIGATQGYVYVRAEYPIAVERLQKAIDQSHAYGFLGENIFGSGFSFDIGIRLGSGAFVCGEETALMVSIEGKRGEPRNRPPYPAVKGLFGKPTILNNVETYANIPWIINHGAAEYAKFGTEGSKGTKVFALGGKIANTGLVEIPMGTPLRTIVEKIGGGVPGGKKFKAVQAGGPSGACIPASQIDVPIDYENLSRIGAMMGSGGMIVLDETDCMVDIAKFFLEFTVDESCGKCSPCRIGTKRMFEILTKITDGNGTLEDLDTLEELATYICQNSLCGLGQTAPNPVLSTLRHFRDEYVAHVVDRKCPAGVCKNLLTYKIDADKCKGCSACARVCPADAITKTDYTAPGAKLPAFAIDASKCIKCGSCVEKCKFGAISKG